MGELLSVFYSRTQQSDQVVVEAKLEICRTLHLIYDMYTDLRIKTLVARYRQLFDEWVTNKLWRKKGDNGHPLKPFEETVPFDKPDDGVERKLPASLHAQYPGLDTHLTYADVFERKWLPPARTERRRAILTMAILVLTVAQGRSLPRGVGLTLVLEGSTYYGHGDITSQGATSRSSPCSRTRTSSSRRRLHSRRRLLPWRRRRSAPRPARAAPPPPPSPRSPLPPLARTARNWPASRSDS